MVIDLDDEEVKFIERIVRKAVVFSEMNDWAFTKIPSAEARVAKRLMEKFIWERK